MDLDWLITWPTCWYCRAKFSLYTCYFSQLWHLKSKQSIIFYLWGVQQAERRNRRQPSMVSIHYLSHVADEPKLFSVNRKAERKGAYAKSESFGAGFSSLWAVTVVFISLKHFCIFPHPGRSFKHLLCSQQC